MIFFVAFDTRLNKNKINVCPRKYTQHNYHLTLLLLALIFTSQKTGLCQYKKHRC